MDIGKTLGSINIAKKFNSSTKAMADNIERLSLFGRSIPEAQGAETHDESETKEEVETKRPTVSSVYDLNPSGRIDYQLQVRYKTQPV